jgi:hypothetical protein
MAGFFDGGALRERRRATPRDALRAMAGPGLAATAPALDGDPNVNDNCPSVDDLACLTTAKAILGASQTHPWGPGVSNQAISYADAGVSANPNRRRFNDHDHAAAGLW